MKILSLHAIEGIPLIQQGNDIGAIILEAAEKEGFSLENGDIVVIASKIVSKAEGRLVDTYKIKPSKKAISLAKKIGMDPRNLEVILRETKRLLIVRPDLLLTEHRLGFICTKAGVDSSNTTAGPKGRVVSLLPRNPDASARKIRQVIEKKIKKNIAVIINDTFGRPDRKGSVGIAIGISGISAIYSPSEKKDLFGKERHPAISQVDEIAAAASLLMGQTSECRPVVVVRGVKYQPSETDTISSILQPYKKFKEDALEIAKRIKNKK